MQFITLTWAGKHEKAKTFKARADAIDTVETVLDKEGAHAAIRTAHFYYLVQETVDEILAKIAEATKPVTVAWAEPPKAMPENVSVYWEGHTAETWYRRLATMEAERDAYRNAYDVEKQHKANLKERIHVLEAERDTARKALDFQVAERQKLEAKLAATEGDLRNQEGWAENWCKRANVAEKEVAELKAQVEAWKKAAAPRDVTFVDQFYANGVTPENLERALRDAQSWLNQSKHEIEKSRQIANAFPLSAWRILATAVKALEDFAQDENRVKRDRLEAKAAAHAIIAFGEGTLATGAYDCTSL